MRSAAHWFEWHLDSGHRVMEFPGCSDGYALQVEETLHGVGLKL
jgi:hypothetical protein